MTRKKQVHVATLETTWVGRADTDQPFEMWLTFSNVTGPAGAPGREAVARLRYIELADVLAMIPGSHVPDPFDVAALQRVRALLARIDEVR
jgi:hypothetical protein